jgi:hypothetical protein
VQSSQPRRDQEACRDCKIQECKHARRDILLSHNKEIESHIFLDISQEGVNHGNTCVM